MIIEKKSLLKQALEQCSSMQKFDEFNIEKRLVITTSDMGSGGDVDDDVTEKLTVINVKDYNDDLNKKTNDFNDLILKPEVARIVESRNNNANDPNENNNINTSKLTAEELLNIWMKRTITSSKSANKTSLVDVLVRPKSQSTENESLLPNSSLNDDDDDNNSGGKDSVCHSTHITSNDQSPKKTESKTNLKFHLISTNIDHPYCNLSKPDKIPTKKTLKKQETTKRIKRKTIIKKTNRTNTKIGGGKITKRSNKSKGFLKSENLTIVPIKVEFNEINGDTNSKILVLNDFNPNAIINSLNLFGSKFEPKMSTMVRDTAVRYINDSKQITANNFEKSMHYNWSGDVEMPTDKMASQFSTIYDPTFGSATSLPSVQTILNDTQNQYPSNPLRNFVDANIKAYIDRVQINDHNIDCFIGSLTDEDNNLSEDKCLPYGYTGYTDENDMNQSISPFTLSNDSPPILDGFESFNIQNNQNSSNINNGLLNKHFNINDVVNNVDDGEYIQKEYLITSSMFGNDQMLSNDRLTYPFGSGRNQTIKDLSNIISHQKSKLPMNNKISQDLTLAELNSPNLTIKEEEGKISDTWSFNDSGLIDNEIMIDINETPLANPIVANGKSLFAKKMSNPGQMISNVFSIAPIGLDENVMDDGPLEIDSFFQSHQSNQAQNDSQRLEQSIVTDSSQMFPINTSISNNSFVMQDPLSRMFSSPQLQGQSNFEKNDQSTSLNYLYVRNNSRNVNFSEFVPYNSRTGNHLVSKSLPHTTMMTHPESTALISNPFSENANDDHSNFNIPSNSRTTLSPTNVDHAIGNHNPNTNTNNRIRNNSLSTSCDEGFAEDDFDESDTNSERIVSNHNNVLTENMLEGQVFLVNDPQNGHHQIANVQGANENLIKEEIIDGIWSFNDHQQQQNEQQQPQVLSQINMNDHKMFCGQNSSSFSAIDENEESDEEDDESFYGNYDASDLIGATISDDINNKWSINMGRSRKGNDKRHFWQYNVQSKGPKGPRIGTGSLDEDDDPHVFKEIADPVFSPDCPVEGVKHSGKARRGDGNDLTANPKKLLMIGLELKKLSKVINDLTPVTEVPTVSRNESRKEKNKLASRACRLKKKAQHEANKIKLHGLYSEHCKLVKLINKYRHLIKMAVECIMERKTLFTIEIDETSHVIKSLIELDPIFQQLKATKTSEIAGKTADFVNLILDNVTKGIPDGGINNY